MASFKAQVSDFVKQTKRDTTLVHRQAVQDFTEAVVEDTPVDTGNARRSWLGSSSTMPPVRPDAAEFLETGATELTIATLDVGDTYWLGAQAAYVPRLNYGFTGTDSLGRSFNQQGKGWIEKHAALWPTYVKAAERKVVG